MRNRIRIDFDLLAAMEPTKPSMIVRRKSKVVTEGFIQEGKDGNETISC
jgi:hypothetical protein